MYEENPVGPDSALVQSVLPGIAAAFPTGGGVKFTVRCWSFTPGGRQLGLSLGPAGVTAAAFEGGVQVRRWGGGGRLFGRIGASCMGEV